MTSPTKSQRRRRGRNHLHRLVRLLFPTFLLLRNLPSNIAQLPAALLASAFIAAVPPPPPQFTFTALSNKRECLSGALRGRSRTTILFDRAGAPSASSGTKEDASITTDSASTDDEKTPSAFQMLAGNITVCLAESDKKRDDGWDGASTGWTSWIDEASSGRLQSCIDSLGLREGGGGIGDNDNDDRSLQWMRWIRSTPAPTILELSNGLRDAVVEAQRSLYQDAHLLTSVTAATEEGEEGDTRIEEDEDSIIDRIGCRLIVLPSGTSLKRSLQSPPGTMVFGTLLLGGVTRYRLLGSTSSASSSSTSSNSNGNRKPKRRAGERRLIREKTNAGNSNNNKPAPLESWLQYGGPERNYDAVGMGQCLLMEIILYPKGLQLDLLTTADDSCFDNDWPAGCHDNNMLVAGGVDWNPHQFLVSVEAQQDVDEEGPATIQSPLLLGPDESACDLESSFCTTVGGLRPQIDEIVRRVLDGRVVRPASRMDDDDLEGEEGVSSAVDRIRREEMRGLLELGLDPVRGLLLYGPPGGGKTLLAREISTILDARPPKIVAAPELLDRWVGGSERLIRELFDDAEQELKACNGDPTKSALHVVVIDEIDAVFRMRSATAGGGEVTRASAVNQILAKLDGIDALGNVLLIGMTNRKELLDPALLRPGRLEVLVKIDLPDREGRREILKIHFNPLRKKGRLSLPLCAAIDGAGKTKTVEEGSEVRRMFPGKRRFASPFRHRIKDLADERYTGGFSGADIAGLVRCAGSVALARSRSQGDGGLDGLLITLDDVKRALKEVKQ